MIIDHNVMNSAITLDNNVMNSAITLDDNAMNLDHKSSVSGVRTLKIRERNSYKDNDDNYNDAVDNDAVDIDANDNDDNDNDDNYNDDNDNNDYNNDYHNEFEHVFPPLSFGEKLQHKEERKRKADERAEKELDRTRKNRKYQKREETEKEVCVTGDLSSNDANTRSDSNQATNTSETAVTNTSADIAYKEIRHQGKLANTKYFESSMKKIRSQDKEISEFLDVLGTLYEIFTKSQWLKGLDSYVKDQNRQHSFHILIPSSCQTVWAKIRLHILQWAVDNGCDWNSWTCEAAAEGGYFHILQWAREHGCDWDWMTCYAAAEGGHLHILQWARENGCDWTSETCSAAASKGHWDIVVWAVQNGVTMDDHDTYVGHDQEDDYIPFNLCEFAANVDRWDIVKLALEYGCECSEYTKRRFSQQPSRVWF